jgi:hypothetical protein
MINKKIIFGSLIYSFSVNSYAIESSSELLSNALNLSSSIDSSMSTKQRLDAYKSVISNIGKIQENFAGSPEEIQISSGQKIGEFDINAIRDDYINELSGYYNIVCEVSPSYECLAFVSLKEGVNGCQEAKDYLELYRSHSQLKNSLNIFSGQKSDPAFISLSLNAYRSCASQSKFKIDEWSKDSFSSYLVPALLELNNNDTAKAVIETIKTPFFKFRGVTEIKIATGKVPDEAYVDRLDTYIAKKMKGKDAFLANLELRKFATQYSDMPINYDFSYDAIQKVREFGSKTCHGGAYQDFLSDSLFEFGVSLMTLPKERQRINTSQINSMTKYLSIRPETVLNACVNAGQSKLSTKLHMALQVAQHKGPAEGKIFWHAVKYMNITEVAIYDLYMDAIEITMKEIEISPENWVEAKKHGVREIHLLKSADANYSIYKRFVDHGMVCEATNKLFKELKGSSIYSDAVEYMIKSPHIDSKTTYKCGDEDLELLLN